MGLSAGSSTGKFPWAAAVHSLATSLGESWVLTVSERESRALRVTRTDIEDIEGMTRPIATYAVVFLQYSIRRKACAVARTDVRLAVVREYVTIRCTTARKLKVVVQFDQWVRISKGSDSLLAQILPFYLGHQGNGNKHVQGYL